MRASQSVPAICVFLLVPGLVLAGPGGSILTWGRQTRPTSGPLPFIDIAAGRYHSVGVRADGVLFAWGDNTYQQCNLPADRGGVTEVVGAAWHSLGLRSDGSIVTWGNRLAGEINVPPPNSNFIAIGAGENNSLAIRSDHTLVMWGPYPVSVFTGHDYIAATGGASTYTLALHADGTLTSHGLTLPIDIYEGYPFSAICARDRHAIGLRTDGTLTTWGSPGLPLPPNNSGFARVALGFYHYLAIKNDGSIIAIGDNSRSQCNVPPGNDRYTKVAGGGYHSLALRSDGTIAAWGDNAQGQCDIPLSLNQFVDVRVAARTLGDPTFYGLREDGIVAAWGATTGNQLIIPSPDQQFRTISAYGSHCAGVSSDGSIVPCGGVLPGTPADNFDFIDVAAGNSHDVGLRADGRVAAWGNNSVGQCNVPALNQDFIAVAAGEEHSMALRNDGTVEVWGINSKGQGVAPATNGGFVAVAAGAMHNLCLRQDGSIAAWGSNDMGECNVPEPNRGFIAIAAGYEHSVALRNDGTFVGWGRNDRGQCNPIPPNQRFARVSAGGASTAVIQRDLATVPRILRWRSVRSHSGTGDIPIDLIPTLSGNGALGPVSEPRQGGFQTLEIVLDRPVTLAETTGIRVTGHITSYLRNIYFLRPPIEYTPSSIALTSPNTLVLDFAPPLLPASGCFSVTIPVTAFEEGLIPPNQVMVRSHWGDVNSDGDVTLGDAVHCRNMLNLRSTDQNAPGCDVNLSGGLINVGDTLSIRSRTGAPNRILCP